MIANNGYESRHFIKNYLLPGNVQADALESSINNGILTVTAPASILPAQSDNTEKEEYFEQTEEDIVEILPGSAFLNTERKEYVGHAGEKARAKNFPGSESGNTEKEGHSESTGEKSSGKNLSGSASGSTEREEYSERTEEKSSGKNLSGSASTNTERGEYNEPKEEKAREEKNKESKANRE